MAVMKEDRFIKTVVDGGGFSDNYMAIYVDRKTGVNYLFTQNGYAGGLTVLVAQGEKESAILRASAEKEAAILRAEAERQSAILKAQGEAEAIRAVQQALADSLEMLNEKAPNDQVIKLKSIEAMQKIADGKATKIIIPSEMQGLVGMANGIVEGIKE